MIKTDWRSLLSVNRRASRARVRITNLILVSGTIVVGSIIGIYLGSIVMVGVLHRISID